MLCSKLPWRNKRYSTGCISTSKCSQRLLQNGLRVCMKVAFPLKALKEQLGSLWVTFLKCLLPLFQTVLYPYLLTGSAVCLKSLCIQFAPFNYKWPRCKSFFSHKQWGAQVTECSADAYLHFSPVRPICNAVVLCSRLHSTQAILCCFSYAQCKLGMHLNNATAVFTVAGFVLNSISFLGVMYSKHTKYVFIVSRFYSFNCSSSLFCLEKCRIKMFFTVMWLLFADNKKRLLYFRFIVP